MRLRDLDRSEWRTISDLVSNAADRIAEEDETALLPEDSVAVEVYHLLNRAGALAAVCAISPAARMSRARDVVAEAGERS